MTTYIFAAYCSRCNEYFKHVGGGAYGGCSICSTPLIGKMVEKHGEQDPNIKGEFVNIGYKDNPRYSVSMGVTETQIEEARKLHPQAEWKRFGHSFRPLIKNRPEKLKMMKQCGMEEFGVEQFKGRG